MIATSIAAHDTTTYGELLPIIKRLDGFGVEVRFESRRMEGVGVTIEIRSDARLLPRTEMRKAALRQRDLGEPSVTYISKEDVDAVRSDLDRLGVSETTIETIEILPVTRFSVDTLHKLMRQGRRVLVICEAAWDVESHRIEKEILLNLDVISAAKRTRTVVMRVDMTHRLPADQSSFLKENGIMPLSFCIFDSQGARPRVVRGAIPPDTFIKLLDRNTQ